MADHFAHGSNDTWIGLRNSTSGRLGKSQPLQKKQKQKESKQTKIGDN